MEQMMRRNALLIRINTTKEKQARYKTVIQINNINSFVGVGSTELESREGAAINAVDYFVLFAERVFS